MGNYFEICRYIIQFTILKYIDEWFSLVGDTI